MGAAPLGVLPTLYQPLPASGSWGPGQSPHVNRHVSPRSGLLIYPEGPLSLEQSPEQMSRVFSPFYNLLKKIRYAAGGNGHLRVRLWGSSGAVTWG